MTLVRRPGMKPLRDEIEDYIRDHPSHADMICGEIGIRWSGDVETRLERYKEQHDDSNNIWFYVDKFEELAELLKEHGFDPSHTNNIVELYEFACKWLATIKVRHDEGPERHAVVTAADKIETFGIDSVIIQFSDDKESSMKLSGRLAIGLIERALVEEAKIIGEHPPSSGRPIEPHTEAIVFLGQLADTLYPLFPGKGAKGAVYDFIESVLRKYGYRLDHLKDATETIRKQLPSK